MPETLEQQIARFTASVGVEVDEHAARRTLRSQIARLERELARALIDSFPARDGVPPIASAGGPRILDLGELERLRDDLAQRMREARDLAARRAEREARARELLEQMLADPTAYKWIRVSNEDLGLPGCRHWHVRPKLGPVGLLMGWWRVKISSGCPLAGGSRLCRGPA